MAKGVLGSIADDDAVKNPLGGLSTGIGVGYRAKYGNVKKKFPFAATSIGLLHRIGSPAGSLLAVDPLAGTSTRDLKFWQATADVPNATTFPDAPTLGNYSGDTLKAGEGCWGVGGSAPPAPPQQTVLLCHLDGSGGSTVVTDVKGHPVQVQGAGTIIAFAAGLFQQCLLVSGGMPNGLVIKGSPDFILSGDFTLEFWLQLTQNADEAAPGQVLAGRAGQFEIRIDSNNLLTLLWGGATLFYGGHAPYVVGPFQHFVLQRAAGLGSFYLNGVLVKSGMAMPQNTFLNNVDWYIGAIDTVTRNVGVNVDEVRLTKGAALYSGASFTPPNAPFNDADALFTT